VAALTCTLTKVAAELTRRRVPELVFHLGHPDRT